MARRAISQAVRYSYRRSVYSYEMRRGQRVVDPVSGWMAYLRDCIQTPSGPVDVSTHDPDYNPQTGLLSPNMDVPVPKFKNQT